MSWKKILFWLLRLNTALKMCSASSLQKKGVWSPQAELPAGASSTAGFSSPIYASMYYSVKFFRFSKKNWQIPRVFITQEIPLLKHFVLIPNQDKNSKYPFGLFHTGKTFPCQLFGASFVKNVNILWQTLMGWKKKKIISHISILTSLYKFGS